MGAKASAGFIDSQAAKHGGTDAWIAPAGTILKLKIVY